PCFRTILGWRCLVHRVCGYVRLLGHLETSPYELAGTSRPAHRHLRFVISVLAEVRRSPAYDPGIEAGRRLPTAAHWPAHPQSALGGGRAGTGHCPEAAARPGPCLCVLGLLRFRPGDAQPLRRRIRPGLPVPWRLLAFLLPVCRRVRRGRGCLDRGAGLSPVRYPAEVA